MQEPLTIVYLKGLLFFEEVRGRCLFRGRTVLMERALKEFPILHGLVLRHELAHATG